MEPRKKSGRIQTLTPGEFLLILDTKDAIEPDEALIDNGNGNRVSRYSSCDPRWRSDFMAKVAAAGVKPLFHYQEGR